MSPKEQRGGRGGGHGGWNVGTGAADERWAYCAIVNTGKRPIPEIRAYFSFCPAITAALRLHGRAATNMDAVARTVEGKKGNAIERTKKRRREGRVRAKRSERGISRRKRPHFVFLWHPSWSPRIFIALAAGKNMFYLYFIFSLSFSLSLSFFFSMLCFVIHGQRRTRSAIVDSHRRVTTKYEVEIQDSPRGEETRTVRIYSARRSFP